MTFVPTKIQNNKTKAIWLWQASRITTDTDNIISLLVNNNFNLLFVPYNSTVSNDLYASFISKCTSNNIDVHSLHGSKEWGLNDYRYMATTKINSIHTYNQSVNTNERFKGIHFDVETYLTDQWKNPTQRTDVIRQWVNNMQIYKNLTKSLGYTFGGSFPFWLDTSVDVNDYMPVEYNKKLHEIFIDIVDYYAIMSYRDKVSGIMSVADNEIKYAKSPKVLVSVELTKQNPLSISFYDEGLSAAESAIGMIDGQYQGVVGYKGVAVHDLEQYEEFLKWM